MCIFFVSAPPVFAGATVSPAAAGRKAAASAVIVLPMPGCESAYHDAYSSGNDHISHLGKRTIISIIDAKVDNSLGWDVGQFPGEN